uniref:Uncharacterized protein n=1 Tax=Lepeophtheirus salmonis TaxID=72036 RepID=A0A0K2SX35_LEPSM
MSLRKYCPFFSSYVILAWNFEHPGSGRRTSCSAPSLPMDPPGSVTRNREPIFESSDSYTISLTQGILSAGGGPCSSSEVSEGLEVLEEHSPSSAPSVPSLSSVSTIP